MEEKGLLKIDNVFDPRLSEVENSEQVIWNSQSVYLAKKGLAEGYKLKASPFLPRQTDFQLRKANLPFQYTKEELDIYNICLGDKVFFGNNFIQLKDGNEGWQAIKLRSYQERLLKSYTDNRWNIILFPRQSGKTTTTIVEIVYFATFNWDKDIIVIAQSETVVNEILSKIKQAFSALPFFLQPGFVKFTNKGFVLDNGCRLSIGVASESVIQGFSVDFLFIDEFAYISPTLANKFWINIYPSLVNNPQSKCIIASTPNGRNLFYDLWINAISKNNGFIPSSIHWTDVPNRDEKFKEDTIKIVGLSGWLMGFECSFDTNLRSILNTVNQQEYRKVQKDNEDKWSIKNDLIGEIYGIEFIDKSIVNYSIKNDYFLLGFDIAEGLGGDYSTIKIRKIQYNPELDTIEYISVGVYHNNMISVDDFAEMTINLVKHFNINNIRLVIENNNFGGEFINHISNLYKYDEQYNYFDNMVLAKFIRTMKYEDNINNADKFEIGIRWNRETKPIGVKALLKLINNKVMLETHSQTIEEYFNFGKSITNNSYQAQYGNDDLIMTDVMLAYYVVSNNVYAKEFLESVEFMLRKLHENKVNTEQDLIELKKQLIPEEYNNNGWKIRNHENYVNKNNTKIG